MSKKSIAVFADAVEAFRAGGKALEAAVLRGCPYAIAEDARREAKRAEKAAAKADEDEDTDEADEDEEPARKPAKKPASKASKPAKKPAKGKRTTSDEDADETVVSTIGELTDDELRVLICTPGGDWQAAASELQRRAIVAAEEAETDEIAGLIARIEELEDAVELLTAERDEARAELALARKAPKGDSAKVKALEAEVSNANGQIAELRLRLQSTNAENSKMAKQLMARVDSKASAKAPAKRTGRAAASK